GVSVPGPGDGMSFALGPVHLAGVLIAALSFREMRRASPRSALMVAFFIGVTLVAAFMSIGESQFIWDRVQLLQYLEYPWRFHVLADAAMAFVLASLLLIVPRRHPGLANGVAAGLVLLVVAFNFTHA